MINIMEEVTSSSAQRSTLPFKGVGWRRCSSLERIQILCEVAKGRALQSPIPVTRPPRLESAWPGVTTRPNESTPCGPPYGHGTLDGPGLLQHPVLPVKQIYEQFFNSTAAALAVLLQLQL